MPIDIHVRAIIAYNYIYYKTSLYIYRKKNTNIQICIVNIKILQVYIHMM